MMVSSSPADLHAHLGYWLRAVSNAVSNAFARHLDGAGVTVAEWVFLRTLHDFEAVGPSQLAERMGMTKGAISKLAERLVGKRLVVRADDPGDGRAHQLALTPAGRVLVPRLAVIADANDANFFDALSPAERRQLRAVLRKIARAHDLISPPLE